MTRSSNAGMQEPIKVRNKDIPTLARVLTAMQDVTNTEEMRDWIRERMFNVTQHLSGMPGGGSSPKGLDDTFAKLSEIDEDHRGKCKTFIRELEAAERILNAIHSPGMRTFVTMKYVMDIPNTRIMQQLNMSEWRFNQARACVEQAADMAHVDWKESYELVKN